METKSREWDLWRGSPELLAQVVRTGLREVSSNSGGTPGCTIDVEVEGDHEVFSSPEEFASSVTREALRRFKQIDIAIDGSTASATIALTWRRAWWAVGRGPDAQVRLEVAGPSEGWAEAALKKVSSSIERGKTNRQGRQLAIGLLIAYTLAALAAAAIASSLYLLDIPANTIVIVSTAVGALGSVAGTFWGTWMYPSLEVAPHGQTNLARTVKFWGPLVIGFILTGLAKLLYG